MHYGNDSTTPGGNQLITAHRFASWHLYSTETAPTLRAVQKLMTKMLNRKKINI